MELCARVGQLHVPLHCGPVLEPMMTPFDVASSPSLLILGGHRLEVICSHSWGEGRPELLQLEETEVALASQL